MRHLVALFGPALNAPRGRVQGAIWRTSQLEDWTIVRLALFQPDIPQNTGTLLRLGACLGVPVDAIGPMGFDLSDRALRRAALDYLDATQLVRHMSWDAYLLTAGNMSPRRRHVLLSTHAELAFVDFQFSPDDTLILGRESSGVPSYVSDIVPLQVRVPMRPGQRSLNVAVAAAMVLGEALRQTDGFSQSALPAQTAHR